VNKNTTRKGKREIEINPMRYEIISRGQPGILESGDEASLYQPGIGYHDGRDRRT